MSRVPTSDTSMTRPIEDLVVASAAVERIEAEDGPA